MNNIDNSRVEIILYKDHGNWSIMENGKIILYVDTKAKGYKEIRKIIKSYEKK